MAQAAIGTPSRKVCTQLGGAPAGLRKTAAIQRPSASPARAVTTEAAKKKGGAKRQDIRITLECTEQRGSDVKGMSRYTTEKNRRKTPDRLELMKYNKFLGRHTLHREIKGKK